jgi:hypothetical protein
VSDKLDFNDVIGMVEPLILEIYLNSNNYKDRLLINDLRKKAQIVKMPSIDSNAFFVKSEEVSDILYEKYLKDIQNFESTPISTFIDSANSVFYIEAILREFICLKYFKINVSDKSISRDTSNVFEYKIMHSKVDLANSVAFDFLDMCVDIFTKIGIYNNTTFYPKPYIEISVKDLFSKLLDYQLEFDKEDEEYLDVIDVMMIFGNKLERDNATCMIIMQK